MRIVIPILIVLFVSCKQDSTRNFNSVNDVAINSDALTPAALISWSEENNHQTKQQEIGELTYTLTHISPDYLAIHELGVDATPAQIDSLKKDYSEMDYFRLKIEAANHSEELLKYNLQSAEQYDDRVRYCSFNIANDLSLEADNASKVRCGLNHFERAFNAAPFITVMIAFPKTEIKNNVTVVFDDHLFNKGLIRFSWTAEAFNTFPSVNEN
jgi:hypothetical protein